MNNIIMDYEQVEERLDKIAKNGIIKKEEDLGTSTYGLPIEHYTVGSGSKEIVVTGATHGCEIISTDFVLNLMEQISNGENPNGINLSEYKIHFVPMLNPEGYLISTSAIRQLIPREMSSEEAEKICKEYYLRYRKDDADANKRNRRIKKLQEAKETGSEGEIGDILQEEIESIKESIDVSTLTERLTESLKEQEQEGDSENKEHIGEENIRQIATVIRDSELEKKLEAAKQLDNDGKMNVIEELIDLKQIVDRLVEAVKADDVDELNMISEVLLDASTKPPFRNPKYLKRFQMMFKDVDYRCIPEKYLEIRNSVKDIYERYPDIPKGTLQIWSANANGIDPQANSEYNDVIIRILNGELSSDGELYKNNLRYSNINSIHPGPINCGYDHTRGFCQEPEIKAIADLLQGLSEKQTLHSYFNYHGTGGVLYQRPYEVPEGIKIGQHTMWTRMLDNFAFSKFYASKTYKDANNKEKSRYRILTGTGKANSSNDIFRIKYPRDILVEVSGMGGNPIGPYGDLKGNYPNLIQSNLDAFNFTIGYADISEKISSASIKVLEDRMKNGVPEDIAAQMYKVIGTASNTMMSWINRFGRRTKRQVLSGWSRRFDVTKDER